MNDGEELTSVLKASETNEEKSECSFIHIHTLTIATIVKQPKIKPNKLCFLNMDLCISRTFVSFLYDLEHVKNALYASNFVICDKNKKKTRPKRKVKKI